MDVTEVNSFQPEILDIEKLHDFISGYTMSAALYVASKLKIADYLADSPKNSLELAEILNVNEQALYRLLRALSGVNIFYESDDGYFSLTRLSLMLKSTSEYSQRDLILMCGSHWFWEMWGGLLYTVETGEPFFVKNFGTDFFPYIQSHPKVSQTFNAAMSSLSSLSNYAIARTYDFSKSKVLVDVGGGEGGLIQSILHFFPKLNGILYDLPAVVDSARKLFQDKVHLAGKCELIPGDFFENIPSGGDTYIIKHVFHGLDNDQCIKVLNNVLKVIPSNGKLLIIEMVIPAPNVSSYSKFNDITMMLLSNTGKERTLNDFHTIVNQTNFKINLVLPVQMGIYIIECEIN